MEAVCDRSVIVVPANRALAWSVQMHEEGHLRVSLSASAPVLVRVLDAAAYEKAAAGRPCDALHKTAVARRQSFSMKCQGPAAIYTVEITNCDAKEDNAACLLLEVA